MPDKAACFCGVSAPSHDGIDRPLLVLAQNGFASFGVLNVEEDPLLQSP
jgi:hypothetical protein